jgi:hypothetical protein
VRNHAIVWGDVCANAVFDQELRAGVRRITRTWRDTVTGAIERGVADGSIGSGIDPETSAETLITLIEGLSVRWLAGSIELGAARDLMTRALKTLRA